MENKIEELESELRRKRVADNAKKGFLIGSGAVVLGSLFGRIANGSS